MAQLKIDDFTFESQTLSSLGFKVVSVGSNSGTRNIGRTRSVTKVEGIGGEYCLEKTTQTANSVDIVITKVDDNGGALPITDEDIDKINEWLFTPNDYKALRAMQDNIEIVYYGIFIDATQTYMTGDYGYITLKFEMDGNHAYSITQKITHDVEDELSFYVDVIDNVSEYLYPDFEFEVDLDRNNSFKVKNETLGITMTFSDLDNKSKKGKVYGDNMMFMVSQIDSTINMRAKSNKTFLKLKRGRNKITVTGKGRYSIIMQPKIALR